MAVLPLTGAVWVCVVWAVWSSVGVGVTAGEAESGELYSSLAQLERLFNFDQVVGETLMNLPEHLPAVSSYLASYTALLVDRSRRLPVTSSPLHVYALIRRVWSYWPAVKKALKTYQYSAVLECRDERAECGDLAMSNECAINREYMLQLCPRSCHICPSEELVRLMGVVREAEITAALPTETDMKGASVALARLQKVYRIPVGSFMAGHLADVTSALKLDLEDCIQVARSSFEYGMFSWALTWLQYCQFLSTHTTPISTPIHALIKQVEREHNTRWVPGGEDFFKQPISSARGRRILQDSPVGPVCRGEIKPVTGRGLQCHVSHRGSPYLLLQPVRYEQLHTHPALYIYYNVISPAEIATLKNISKGILKRAEVFVNDPNSTKSFKNPVRVSHTAFLDSELHPVVSRITARVEAITGLHLHQGSTFIKADQHLQVQNYGTGGHYASHHDVLFRFAPEEEMSDCVPAFQSGCNEVFRHGDRLATWMFYLSNVTAGGWTGFPEVGISVPPVKGAAVFWYNLKRSGVVDWNTRHCGCPVIMGHKWVANKWIREHVNFLTHPCMTNPMD